jgi:peptide deformylase
VTGILPFVCFPHPALSAPAATRPLDAAMERAGEQLLAAAEAAKAYGLAAAHVGLNEPVIVVSIAADTSRRDYRVMFNPRIAECSAEAEVGSEGSVSLPGIEVAISRPIWAVIEYDTAAGDRVTKRFDGFVARCCLHEIEQMQGVFFLSHLSRLKRETVLRRFKKEQRAG